MKVSDALHQRISCRSFLSKKISKRIIKKIIEQASKSPSGGNLQPWKAFILSGEPLKKLVTDVEKELIKYPKGHVTEYKIYPDNLPDLYMRRRYKCGEDLYSLLQIKREDKENRIKQFKKNFNLFGAPVGIFVFINRSMGYPQWSDLGMFVQSVLLLAKENNLDTCAQESWALFHKLVHKQVKAPKEYMLFCGIAIGHMDKTNVINKIRTERANIDDLAEFFGFED